MRFGVYLRSAHFDAVAAQFEQLLASSDGEPAEFALSEDCFLAEGSSFESNAAEAF